MRSLNQIARALSGRTRLEERAELQSYETFTLTGTAVSDSENGSVRIRLTDNVTHASWDEGGTDIEIPTNGHVSEGQRVYITCFGGSMQEMVVTGVVGEGDEMNARITAAEEAADVARATNQHFWTDTNGAHVTDDTQANWGAEYAKSGHGSLADPTDARPWHNILLNSLGILLRRGLRTLVSITKSSVSFYDGTGDVTASFGPAGALIGSANGRHAVLDSDGLSVVNADGTIAPITGELDGRNITDASIENSKFVDGTIEGSKIKNSTIEGSKFVDGTITGSKIAGGTITGTQIAQSTITDTNIVDGTITGTKINAATFKDGQISGSVIDTSTFRDGQIEGSKINASTFTDGQIDGSKIKDSSILGGKIQGATLTDIPFAAITDAEIEVANIADAQITNATIEQAQVRDLNADYAHISEGVIDNATIDHADVNDLDANYAHITEGVIDNATISYADVDDLEANYAHVKNGVIDNAKIGYADVNDLNANYAQVNMANVNNAWINNGVIRDAAIKSEMVHSVSANKLTAGTINAAEIDVTNLHASSLIVDKLNGQPVIGGYTYVNKNSSGYASKNPKQQGWYELTSEGFVKTSDTSVVDTKAYYMDGDATELYDREYIDNLETGLSDRIDGAIETFTTDAVPTLNNYPAADWLTDKVREQHVGDICYVTNAGSDYDGYTYRFAYDKTSATYMWVLIKDNQVTAALGRITDLESFESTTTKWVKETDDGLETIRTNHTNLAGRVDTVEGQVALKVDSTTFKSLKDTVDEQSSTITSLSNKTETLANPNLSMFFSMDIGNRDYWISTSTAIENSYKCITNLDDGWAHFERTNSTDATVNHFLRMAASPAVVQGKVYTCLVEFRNVKAKPAGSRMYTQQSNHAQFWGDQAYDGFGISYSEIEEGSTFHKRMTARGVSDHGSAGDYLIDFNFYLQAGQSFDFDIRLSLYEGEYDGPFKPYVPVTEYVTTSNTVNSVKQTADANEAYIKNLTTTLGINDDGTQSETTTYKYNQLDQTLEGTISRVGKTETKLETISNPNLSPFFSMAPYRTSESYDGGYWQPTGDNWLMGGVTKLSDGWAHVSVGKSKKIEVAIPRIKSLAAGDKATLLIEWRDITVEGSPNIYARNYPSACQFNQNGYKCTWDSSSDASGSAYIVMTANSTATGEYDWNAAIDLGMTNGSAVSFDGDLRISLYEGEYSGSYKPYVDQTLSERVTQAETSIEQNKEAITLTAMKSESMSNMLYDTDVDGLDKVYGPSDRYWSNAGESGTTKVSFVALSDPPEPGIRYAAQFVCDGKNTSNNNRGLSFYNAEDMTSLPLVVGQTYAVSWWARCTDGVGYTRMHRIEGAGGVYPPATKRVDGQTWTTVEDIGREWRHISNSFTHDIAATTHNRVWFDSFFPTGTAGTVQICGFKLVPQAYATSAELKVANDNISSKVSTTDYNGQTVASLINQSAESVKIQADHVEIDGAAIFTNDVFQSRFAQSQMVGENLLLRTGRATMAKWARNSTSTVTSTRCGTIRMNMTDSADASATYKVDYLDFADYGEGTYTLSFEARKAPVESEHDTTSIAAYIAFHLLSRIGSVVSSGYDRYVPAKLITDVTDEWRRYTLTATCPDDFTTGQASALATGSDLTAHFFCGRGNHPVEIRRVKLERGDTATPYSEAPSDYVQGGGRNLLRGTADERVATVAEGSTSVYTARYAQSAFLGSLDLTAEETVLTYSFDYEVTGTVADNAYVYAQFRGNSPATYLTIVPAQEREGSYNILYVKDAMSGHYRCTFVVSSAQVTSTDFNVNRCRLVNASEGATLRVWNVKLEQGLDETQWTPAPEDVDSSVEKAQSTADGAVSRTQRIWYRQTESGSKPATNTTWLTTSGTGYGNWSLSVPQLTNGSTKYPKLYTAVQTQTVAQRELTTTPNCSCSPVLLDDSTTVIDGGTVITGSVMANKLDAESVKADIVQATTILADQMKANVVTAIQAKVSDLYALVAKIGGFTLNATSIFSGTAVTSNADNAVALTTADFTRTINDTSRSGLRFAIGDKFGVTGDGMLYANGANITSINAGNVSTGTLSTDVIKTNVINAVNDGQGKINADHINVSQISIGDLSGGIGGRNLLQDTAIWGARAWTNSAGVTSIDGGVLTYGESNTANRMSPVEVTPGETYTISYDIKAESAYKYSSAYCPVLLDYSSSASYSRVSVAWLNKGCSVTTSWQRVAVTFTVPTTSTISHLFVSLRSETGAPSYQMRHMKLEKGYRPTDWEPSPEDQTAYVDGVQIGGRNLLKRSALAGVWSKLSKASVVGGKDDPDGGKGAVLMTPTASDWYASVGDDTLLTDLDSSYAFSVWLRADSATTCDLCVRYLYSDEPYTTNASRKTVSVTTTWQRFVLVGTGLKQAQTADCCWIGQKSTEPIYAYHPKLEKGVKATDWSPAPEDVQSLSAYGESGTAASTAAKAVACEGFTLYAGVSVRVAFAAANTAAAPTLNVNGTGAKAVWCQGAVASGSNPVRWGAGAEVAFFYDGTHWVVADTPPSYSTTCGTAATTRAKEPVVNGALVVNGTTLTVRFTTANTYDDGSVQLNLSETGAQNVYVNNKATSASNKLLWDANTDMTFVRHSSGWFLVSRSDASETATTYLTDITSGGVMVHPSGDANTGVRITSDVDIVRAGNVMNRIDANGMTLYDGSGTADSNVVAKFRNDSAQVGKNGGPHVVIASTGMDVYGDTQGRSTLAHFGYGEGAAETGTAEAPYYTLGIRRTASVGNYSLAEGDNTTASGFSSHSEGGYTSAIGNLSHAEGNWATARGVNSHAEGYLTEAVDTGSHAEGCETTAGGEYSHTQGFHTKTTHSYNTAIGKYNDYGSSIDCPLIIGNGTATTPSNALTVDWSGNLAIAGGLTVGGVIKGIWSGTRNVTFSNAQHAQLLTKAQATGITGVTVTGSNCCVFVCSGNSASYTGLMTAELNTDGIIRVSLDSARTITNLPINYTIIRFA